MKATILDMRRNPKKILEAIARNETVSLTNRVKAVARIEPIADRERPTARLRTRAFGMWADREDMADPSAYVHEMRRGRFRDHSLEVSIVNYMELLQGARDKRDLRLTKAYLVDLGFRVLPLSENIGHRASIYLEEYGLKSSLGVPDALIAATAVENDEVLCSGNALDYRGIAEVTLKVFRP